MLIAGMILSISYDWDSGLFTGGLIWMIIAVIGCVGKRVEIDPEEYADYPDGRWERWRRMED